MTVPVESLGKTIPAEPDARHRAPHSHDACRMTHNIHDNPAFLEGWSRLNRSLPGLQVEKFRYPKELISQPMNKNPPQWLHDAFCKNLMRRSKHAREKYFFIVTTRADHLAARIDQK